MSEPQSIGALASSLVNRWSWYQEALAHPNLIGTIALPIHESDPRQGYYRVMVKGEGWTPVAIYYPEDSDTLVAYRNGKEVRDINSLWTWCCRNPITFEAYERALDGGGWADEPKRAPTIGDNSGDADDHEKLRIEYLGEKEAAEQFLKQPVKTQEDADKCAIWSKRLADITKRAEEFHSIEKRPHLDAGKAVDNKWRELKEDPKALSTRLKRHLDAYAAEQRRIEEERAREARKEQERLQREAEVKIAAAKAEAEAAQYYASVSDLVGEEDPALSAKAEKLLEEARILQAEADRSAKESVAQNFQAGRTGAKVATRTFKVAVITDYDILLMALKDRDEVKELVTSLANRAAKSDFKLPGMKIKTEERVV